MPSRLDFVDARFYHYTLKIEPKPYDKMLCQDGFKFTKKEEAELAALLLDKVGISYLDERFVFGSKFEVFAPSSQLDLETRDLRVLLSRHAERKEDSFKSFTREKPVGRKIWTTLEKGELVEHSDERNLQATCNGTEHEAQVICFVSAQRRDDDASLMDRIYEPYPPKTLQQSGPDVDKLLRMVDAGLKRHAVVAHERFNKGLSLAPSAVVHGDKIFDFTTSPQRLGGWLELRKGIAVQTRILNRGIARLTAPTVQVFFKAMNLSDMLNEAHATYERAVTGSSLTTSDLQTLLVGLKIRKTYGKSGAWQITGVPPNSPSKTYFEHGDDGIITVADYFTKIGKDFAKSSEQACIVVGPLDSPYQPQFLPASVCQILPGQLFNRPHWPALQASVDRSSKDYMRKFPYIDDNLLHQLMHLSISPRTMSSFNFTVEPRTKQLPIERGATFFSQNHEIECNRLTQNISLPSSWKETTLRVFPLVIGGKEPYGKVVPGRLEEIFFEADIASVESLRLEHLPADPLAINSQLDKFFPKEAELGSSAQGSLVTVVLALWVKKSHLPKHNRELKKVCDTRGKHLVSVAVDDPHNLTLDEEKAVAGAIRKARTKTWSSGLQEQSSKTLLIGIHIAHVLKAEEVQDQDISAEMALRGNRSKGRSYKESPSVHGEDLSDKATRKGTSSSKINSGMNTSERVVPESPTRGSSDTPTVGGRRLLPSTANRGPNGVHASPSVSSSGQPIIAQEAPQQSFPVRPHFSKSAYIDPKVLRGDHRLKTEEHQSKNNCFAISIVSKWSGQEGVYRSSFHHQTGPEQPGECFKLDEYLKEHLRVCGRSVANDKRVVIYRSGVRPEQEKKRLPSANIFARELCKVEAFKNSCKVEKVYYITVDQHSKARFRESIDGNIKSLTQQAKGAENNVDRSAENVKLGSSVLAYPGVVHLQTQSWLMQKELSDNGTTQPLALTLQTPSASASSVKDMFLDTFQASWDYPPGVFSSKMVAPVHFARLAARRALVYHHQVTSKEGEPALNEVVQVHGDLKNSLYYI